MQAGRELDAKVAEALGWTEVANGTIYNGKWIDQEGVLNELPSFSTTWEGMGVLVEEAKKQGILLEYEHFTEGRYLGRAWKYHEGIEDWVIIPRDSAFKPPISGSVPLAVSLAFLQMKSTAI